MDLFDQNTGRAQQLESKPSKQTYLNHQLQIPCHPCFSTAVPRYTSSSTSTVWVVCAGCQLSAFMLWPSQDPALGPTERARVITEKELKEVWDGAAKHVCMRWFA